MSMQRRNAVVSRYPLEMWQATVILVNILISYFYSFQVFIEAIKLGRAESRIKGFSTIINQTASNIKKKRKEGRKGPYSGRMKGIPFPIVVVPYWSHLDEVEPELIHLGCASGVSLLRLDENGGGGRWSNDQKFGTGRFLSWELIIRLDSEK